MYLFTTWEVEKPCSNNKKICFEDNKTDTIQFQKVRTLLYGIVFWGWKLVTLRLL